MIIITDEVVMQKVSELRFVNWKLKTGFAICEGHSNSIFSLTQIWRNMQIFCEFS